MKFTYALLLALVVGCASEIQRTPTQFKASTDAAMFLLASDVTVKPTLGYPARLRGGSTWVHVGQVPEGPVYAIKDDVFMVRGRNAHEAQCVISDGGKLIGFFLPVERAFVPVDPQVQLHIDRK
ncbi:MAG TPA: hypothetical protein VFJ70_13470 [Burkholderiales bacterium]|nr:hypothetical protein [Burkholderiales bacterium]